MRSWTAKAHKYGEGPNSTIISAEDVVDEVAEDGTVNFKNKFKQKRYDSSHGYQYDLFVIGGGSGGVRAARMSASYGAKVALCELPFNPVSSETLGGLGGTCVLRGSNPKKILVYGSEFSQAFEDSKGFGWKIPGEVSFNWKKLIENKTREITRLNGVYRKVLQSSKVDLFSGRGSLVNRHVVEVEHPNGEKKTFTTKHILVATGGKPMKLDIPGQELAITSDEGLSLDAFPKRVMIVGGGYVAVEFAGIYSGMGAEVRLFYRKDLPLTGFDKEMRQVVARNMEGRGIKLHPNSNILKLEKHYLGIRALTDQNEEYFADAVMMAVGRKPRTKGMNLEAARVELEDNGAVKVNEYSQSTVPNIWAVGDVTNRMNLTPIALMEGSAFAQTVFAEQPTKPDYANVASAVFCQPPLSVVGLTEEQAIAQAEYDILVFTSSFTPMKNTVSGRQEKTFMKLIVNSRTDRVIGAGMCGPDAAEIIQGVAIALKCGATKAQFDATVGIHPTTAEELVTMRTLTRRVTKHTEVILPSVDLVS